MTDGRTDGQTDRQTDGIAIAYARLAYMLSRAKTSNRVEMIARRKITSPVGLISLVTMVDPVPHDGS